MVVDAPWQEAAPLSARDYQEIRRRTIFECCKWDPQVGDVASLADFPIVLSEAAWQLLGDAAETLYHETLALEEAMIRLPRWHRFLALPRRVRQVLAMAGARGPACGIARLMRFDFHFTMDGWRISEVNSDVPGGFIEASGFTALVAERYPRLTTPDDPAAALVRAVRRRVEDDMLVVLVHATAYTDDRQVMIYLGRMLEAAGVRTCLLGPGDLQWRDGIARVAHGPHAGLVAAIIRFFPAEWLPNLPAACGWPHYFVGGRTPQCNPGAALLTQSKRLPLIWDELGISIPAWRRLLPETRAARGTDWRSDDGWVLKAALGRVGDAVGLRGVTAADHWRRIRRDVRWHAGHWIAQRRFEAVPMPGPRGPVFPCIGVFVIDGRAAGAYGRVSHRPLIDDQAQDAAVLISPGRPAATIRRSVGHGTAGVV